MGKLSPPSQEVPPDLDFQLKLAAAFCTSALKGRKINFKTTKLAMTLRSIYYSRLWRNLITLVAAIHMALALIEPPSTIDPQAPSAQGYVDTRPIQGAILFLYVLEIALKVAFMGVKSYFRSWNIVESLTTLVFALDILTPYRNNGLQFSRVLRPFFIIVRRKHIRFIVNGVGHAIMPMLPVLLLIILIVIAFAAAGALMASAPPFDSLIANSNSTSFAPYCSVFSRGKCEDYFTDSSTNVYSLGVLVARANWPLVMLPLYGISEWTGIFFVVFVLVAHFFAWRLLLASAFSSFASHSREQYLSQQRRSRASFKAAFSLLSTRGFLGAPVFRSLAGLVRPNQPLEVVDIIFASVGGSSGFIDAQQFIVAVSLLDLKASKIPYPERGSRFSAFKARLREFLNKAIVSIASDLVVLGLALTEYLLADVELSDFKLAVTLNNATSSAILALLLLEMITKVIGFGPKQYLKDGFNRVDLLIIALSVVSLAVFDLSDENASLQTLHQRLRIQFLLRMMRSLRLFARIPSVRTVLLTIAEISPLLWRFVIVLACSIYSLAIIGVECFSGLLTKSNADVVASAYGLNNQWPLNWNTFTRGSMSVFSILVTTQSPLLMEGLMAAEDSWWPTAYFFVSYYLLVLVVSNILIALLLQSYGISSSQMTFKDKGFVPIYAHLLAKAQLQLWEAYPKRFKRPLLYHFSRKNAFISVNESIFGESLSLEFEATGVDPLTARAAAAASAAANPSARGKRGSKLGDGKTDAAGGNGGGKGTVAGGGFLQLPGVASLSSFFGNIFHPEVLSQQANANASAAANYAALSLRVHSRFDPVEYFGLHPEGRVAQRLAATAKRGGLHIGFGADAPENDDDQGAYVVRGHEGGGDKDEDDGGDDDEARPSLKNKKGLFLSTMAVGGHDLPVPKSMTTAHSQATNADTVAGTEGSFSVEAGRMEEALLAKSAHDMRLVEPLTKEASRLLQADVVSISSSDEDGAASEGDGKEGDEADGDDATTGTLGVASRQKSRRRRGAGARKERRGPESQLPPSTSASSTIFGAVGSTAASSALMRQPSSSRRRRKGGVTDGSNSAVQFSETAAMFQQREFRDERDGPLGRGRGADEADFEDDDDRLSAFFATKPEPVPTVWRSLTEFILSPLVPPISATDLNEDGKGPNIEAFIAKLIAQGLIHPPKGSKERKDRRAKVKKDKAEQKRKMGAKSYSELPDDSSSSSSSDDDDDEEEEGRKIESALAAADGTGKEADHHPAESSPSASGGSPSKPASSSGEGSGSGPGATEPHHHAQEAGRPPLHPPPGLRFSSRAGSTASGSATGTGTGSNSGLPSLGPLTSSSFSAAAAAVAAAGRPVPSNVPVSNSSLFSRASRASSRVNFAMPSPSGSSSDLRPRSASNTSGGDAAGPLPSSRAARLRRITQLARMLQNEQEALVQSDRALEMSMSNLNLKQLLGGVAEGNGDNDDDDDGKEDEGAGKEEGGRESKAVAVAAAADSGPGLAAPLLSGSNWDGGRQLSRASASSGGLGGSRSFSTLAKSFMGFLGSSSLTPGERSVGAPDVREDEDESTQRRLSMAARGGGGRKATVVDGSGDLDAAASVMGGAASTGGRVSRGFDPSSASSLYRYRRNNSISRTAAGFSDDASGSHLEVGGVAGGLPFHGAIPVNVHDDGQGDSEEEEGAAAAGPLTAKEMQARKAGSRWRQSLAIGGGGALGSNRIRSGTVLGAEVQLRPVASSMAMATGAEGSDLLVGSFVAEPAIVMKDGKVVLDES